MFINQNYHEFSEVSYCLFVATSKRRHLSTRYSIDIRSFSLLEREKWGKTNEYQGEKKRHHSDGRYKELTKQNVLASPIWRYLKILVYKRELRKIASSWGSRSERKCVLLQRFSEADCGLRHTLSCSLTLLPEPEKSLAF